MSDLQTLVEDPVFISVVNILTLAFVGAICMRCFGYCCAKKQTTRYFGQPPNVVSNTNYIPPEQQDDIEQQQQQKGIDQSKLEEIQKLYNEKGLVKVKVPPGKSKGDKFRVRIFDGRSITATVPTNDVSEFYLKVDEEKKKQNWHDNPLAVLPMTVGPFL